MQLFEINIDDLLKDPSLGLSAISIVEEPAVESNFLMFKKAHEIKLQEIDEEKHELFGVALRADFPILRYNEDSGEYYYIKFTAEAIKVLVEKYLAESRQNDVNLQHEANAFVNNVVMTESIIKDTAAGVSPKGFDDIADGSWFVRFKINNDELWEAIKTKQVFNGFSVEMRATFNEAGEIEPQQNDFDLTAESVEAAYRELFAGVSVKAFENAMKSNKQVAITYDDGHTEIVQVYATGKDEAVVYNTGKEIWESVPVKAVKSIKILSNTPIVAWANIYDAPGYDEVINDTDAIRNTVIINGTDINAIMDGNYRVMIVYNDDKNTDGLMNRLCVIGSYGVTKRGNTAIRVYQYAGSSHSSDTGKGIWRLLLLKRIQDIRVLTYMEPVTTAPPMFNPVGDTGLRTVFKVANFLYD